MAQTNIIPLPHHVRNAGFAFDRDWIDGLRVNLSAAERRAATLPGRRTVKKEWQAAWLLQGRHLHRPHHAQRRRHAGPRPAALRQGAPARARRTCSKALGMGDLGITTGAVCVYHAIVATAVAGAGRAPAFRSPPSPPASPPALSPLPLRIARDRSLGRRRRARDRHRHHPRPCPHRQLAGALRRDARLPRGLRRRAPQGDPRHRRPGDADATSRAPRWSA